MHTLGGNLVLPSFTNQKDAASLAKWFCVLQADKRARQRAKDKERKDGKPETAAAAAGSSKAASGTAAAGGDSFDAELAAAMAEAATISSR